MKLLCFLVFAFLTDAIVASKILVTVKNGTLEGTVMKTRKGRDIFGFRGIPYALPPVGELRFEVSKSRFFQKLNRNLE